MNEYIYLFLHNVGVCAHHHHHHHHLHSPQTITSTYLPLDAPHKTNIWRAFYYLRFIAFCLKFHNVTKGRERGRGRERLSNSRKDTLTRQDISHKVIDNSVCLPGRREGNMFGGRHVWYFLALLPSPCSICVHGDNSRTRRRKQRKSTTQMTTTSGHLQD